MADEVLYNGIVNIDVNDNNAPQRVQDAVQKIATALKGLENLPGGAAAGVGIAEELAQGEASADRLERAFRELSQALSLSGETADVRELGQALDALTRKYQQLQLIQEAAATGSPSRLAVARAEVLRDDRAEEKRRERELADRRRQEAIAQLPPSQQKFVAAAERNGSEETVKQVLKSLGVEEAGPGEKGFAPNVGAVEERIRSRMEAEGDQLVAAQARATAANERLADVTTKQYKTQAQADIAYESALASREQAEINLARVLERHQKAEAKAAAAAEQEAAERAEATRVAGDPRRARLLEEDSKTFLGSGGVDVDMESAKIQELQAQKIKLEQTKAEIISKAKQVDTEADLAKLMSQRESVERQLLANAQAMERQRFTEGGRGGFWGGVFGDFNGSPQGVTKDDIGFQAGQALKFYALYSGLSAVQQAITGLIAVSAQYSQTVADLAIAMRTSTAAAGTAASQYAELGAQMGTGPNEAVAAATKFTRTFRDENGVPDPNAGMTGAYIGSQVNVLEGADRIEGVMNDLVSLLKGYGLGEDGARPAYDQATAIAQQYGFASAGDILPGAAAIGDLGRESGYSMSELMALIAGVAQRTGTTSDAAAGDVKRILGSQDSPDLQNIFASYNIDLDKTFKEKLEELFDKLANVSPEERSRIVTGLGDNRTGAAAAALLEGIPQLRDIRDRVAPGAAGTADAQVQQKLASFGGALQKIQAQFLELAVSIGDTGIVDLLTHLAQAASGLVTIFDAIASVADSLPEPLKKVGDAASELVVALIAAGALSKGVQATRAVFAGSPLLGGLAGGAAGAAAGSGALSAKALGDLQVQRGVALAAGDKVAAAAATQQITAATGAATATRGLAGAVGSVASQAKAAAATLAPLAVVLGSLMVVQNAVDTYDKAKNAADLGVSTTKDFAAYKAAGIDDPDKLEAIMGNFQTSVGQLDEVANNWLVGIGDFLGRTGNQVLYGQDRPGNSALERQRVQQSLYDQYVQAALEQGRLQTERDAVDKARPGDPYSEYFGKSFSQVTYGIGRIKETGVAAPTATGYLDDLISGAGMGKLFPAGEKDKGVAELFKVISERISRSTNPLEQQSQYGALRNSIAKLQAQTAAGTPEGEAAEQLLEQANRQYLDSMTSNIQARIDNIKSTQDENKKSRAQIRSLITDGLKASTAAGDVGSTVQLLQSVDRAFLNTFRRNLQAQRQIIVDQLKTLQEASKAAAVSAAFAREARMDPDLKGRENADPTAIGRNAVNQRAKEALREQLAGYDKMLKTLDSAGNLTNFQDTATKWPGEKEAPSAEDIEAARIAAQARPGDSYSQAVTNMRLARYQLKNAENKVEYWQAYKALKDAQYELSQVELENANNLRLLRIDITDPVDQARAATAAAAAKLRADQKRGASSSVLNADRVALRQAQASQANTAWQQQFGDMQTNYELQRISLSSYLSYLNAQKAYLTAVKNKTRDQVEQLNAVDRALKGLAEGLQGQWNLGDIRMPTAYEMRRAAGGAQQAVVNNVTINGANMAQVMTVLQNLLGAATVQRAASLPQKV